MRRARPRADETCGEFSIGILDEEAGCSKELLMDAHSLKKLSTELDDYLTEFGDAFRSNRSRNHLGTYVRGQLGPLPRKSVEPMALEAGVAPRTLQEFLSLHVWKHQALRQKVRKICARDHADPDAIGIVDGTDFAKKGTKTVGVKRQYCGELGKIENCVSTVQLAYVTPQIRTLVASDVYLPEDWTEDVDRRRAAGIPDSVEHREKWRIALDLIGRSLRDGLPLRWIAGDSEFGRCSEFVETLELLDLLFVLDVPKSLLGWTPRRREAKKDAARVDQLWLRGGPSVETYHVKDTNRGPLVWNVKSSLFQPTWRSASKPPLRLIVAKDVLSGETKYFLSNAPESIPLKTVLTVAASRWNVERAFEDAKQEVGMRDFEVRKYEAVQRHLALSLVSMLFLARAAARLGGENRPEVVSAPGAYSPEGPARSVSLSLRPKQEAVASR